MICQILDIRQWRTMSPEVRGTNKAKLGFPPLTALREFPCCRPGKENPGWVWRSLWVTDVKPRGGEAPAICRQRIAAERSTQRELQRHAKGSPQDVSQVPSRTCRTSHLELEKEPPGWMRGSTTQGAHRTEDRDCAHLPDWKARVTGRWVENTEGSCLHSEEWLTKYYL